MPIGLYATMNADAMQSTEKPVQVDIDQFRRLLLTGKTDTLKTKEQLNIVQDKNIWIISKVRIKENANGTEYKEVKHIKPMQTINKALFCCKKALGSKASNVVLDLPISLLKDEQTKFFDKVYRQCYCFKQTLTEGLPYPGYPVVYKESNDTKISLQHLTALFRMSAKNINNSMYEATQNTPKVFNDAWNGFILNFINEADKFPDYLETVMNACAEKKIRDDQNKPIEFDTDPRKFQHDKEQLFYSMMWVSRGNGNRIGALEFKNCLEKIQRLNEGLTKVFNANKAKIQSGSYNGVESQVLENQRLQDIRTNLMLVQDKGKTIENLTARNIIARALIIDSFTHMDTVQEDAIAQKWGVDTNTDYLFKSYLNEALFIKHAIDHHHIYHDGDEIPFIAEKSYVILKKGVTAAQFYDALYDAIMSEGLQYTIHNVCIPKSMQHGIEIDIALNDAAKQATIENMIATDGIARADQTSLLRLVYKEEDGVFRLASAYPSYPKDKRGVLTTGKENMEDVLTAVAQFFLTPAMNKQIKEKNRIDLTVIREHSN